MRLTDDACPTADATAIGDPVMIKVCGRRRWCKLSLEFANVRHETAMCPTRVNVQTIGKTTIG